jgi:hypothetical protein
MTPINKEFNKETSEEIGGKESRGPTACKGEDTKKFQPN